MKRILTKNVLTLLAVIGAIVVMHTLQSFRKSNNNKSPVEAVVVKKANAG